MKFILQSEIIISPERQRREFKPEALNELAESIVGRGLLHPIVLRQTPEGLVLVAGERRLRAIADLWEFERSFKCDNCEVPYGHVPYLTLGDLTPLEAEEAELEENIKRVDLTWQESAAANTRLLELRTKQALHAGLELPTPADIAREVYDLPKDTPAGSLGWPVSKIKEDTILQRYMGDSDVKGAATRGEALKVIKKKEQAAKQKHLAETVGKAFTSAAHAVHNFDAKHWMKAAGPEQFDCILTDPPYGMGADSFGDSGVGTAAHGYTDTPEVLEAILEWFPGESYRLTKPQAHAYVFCDIDWFFTWREAMAAAGWKVFRTPIIWHNLDGFRAPWPEQGPQRKYECILYAVKGNKLTTRIYPDVIPCGRDKGSTHPAAKPVALLANLLSRSCLAGDKVLDAFCGGGSIFPAAHELKLFATGLEQDQAYYGASLIRIQELS